MIIIIIILFSFSRFINCNSVKKNLIIGVIKGYKWEKIKTFFISLYRLNLKDFDCVMFISNVNDDIVNKLKSMGIIIIKIPYKYRKIIINNIRYKLYEEYLRKKLDLYNMVIHIDIRDTFFQNDIFKLYENKGPFIGLSLEMGKLSEKINSNWIKIQYGEKIYEELKDKQIICSGVIWGTVDKFYELAKNIWEQIEKSHHKFLILDQSSTNYLIYHKKLFKDCSVMSDNYNGFVMTVGLARYKLFSFDIKNNMLNIHNKKKAAIIHQYDRIPKLVKIVEKKFKNFQSDDNVLDEKNKYIFFLLKLSFFIILKLKRKSQPGKPTKNFK